MFGKQFGVLSGRRVDVRRVGGVTGNGRHEVIGVVHGDELYVPQPLKIKLAKTIYLNITQAYRFREMNCIISSTAVIDLELTS